MNNSKNSGGHVKHKPTTTTITIIHIRITNNSLIITNQ